LNTPAGLLAAACALWGAQTGYWLIAAAAAVALEAPRLAALRWNVEQAHFNRLSDFCSVLVVVVGGYLYFTFGNPRALMLLFQWLPLLLLPLAAAQAWGNLREVDVAAFVWTLRRSGSDEHYALNLGYPCLATWIIAAAAANTSGPSFYAGLAALVAWALWSARPRRYPVALWIVLLAATIGAGYGVHQGLHRTQAWLEEVVPEWIGASGARTDPYRSRTDLGHIGELKQDDAIVLRVRAEGAVDRPLLLHRASYNGYFGGTWTARNAPLLVVRPPQAGAPWALVRNAAPDAARVTVFDYSPHGNPVLSLPRGTVELRGIKALGVKVNRLGTVQAELPPGYFSYVATLGPGAETEAAPGDDDLRLPQNERKLFGEIADRLGLTGLPPAMTADAVKRFFADGFSYATYQPAGPGRSALADFLLRTKAGHCEYYATATVLLLRAGGVPARYATGFSAQEYSRLEDAYIVRVRHAHAWVRAWVDGAWVEIDTTPPAWAAIEDGDASWWAPVSDLLAWVRFRLARIGAGAQDEDQVAAISAGVALLVALWFGWRLYRQRKLMIFGKRAGRTDAGKSPAPGADSELFQIERELSKAGLARAEAETVMAWLARIGNRLPAGLDTGSLIPIALLHYRYRFDPAGLPPSERAQLRALALQWLERWPRLNSDSRA
jgi:transglutaminase-like putative cysteine protease